MFVGGLWLADVVALLSLPLLVSPGMEARLVEAFASMAITLVE